MSSFFEISKELARRILPPGVQRMIRNGRIFSRGKRKIRAYLTPGIYRIHVSPISRGGTAILPLPVMVKMRKSKKTPAENKESFGLKHLFFYYAYKTVFLTDKRAYSFYPDTEAARERLRRIVKYSGEILYPRSEFLEISENSHYTIAKRIVGQSYRDEKHALYFAHELLRLAGQMEDKERQEEYGYLQTSAYRNIRYHVQHGDLKSYNVVWPDDTHYFMIDFDTIGIYPTFYDFFYFILSGEKAEKDVSAFLSGCFDQEIIGYMEAFGINERVEAFKDECLAAFTMVPQKYVPDVAVLCKVVPETYLKTQEALKFRGGSQNVTF